MWLHWERAPGSVHLISSRLRLICLLLVLFSLSLYIVINHSSECNYMDKSCESFQWISKPWGNLRDLWHIFSFSPRYLISCKILLIPHPFSLTSHSVFLLHFYCYCLFRIRLLHWSPSYWTSYKSKILNLEFITIHWLQTTSLTLFSISWQHILYTSAKSSPVNFQITLYSRLWLIEFPGYHTPPPHTAWIHTV